VRISSSLIGFSLVAAGVTAFVACGGDDTQDTSTTTTATTATGTGGAGGATATTTATGSGGAGGATTTTAGTGGAGGATATAAGTGGAGGDATTGAGGAGGDATGAGGSGGGGNPPPPMMVPTFMIWGDYATAAKQEIGKLAFPPGTPAAVPLAGVMTLNQVYDLTQSPDGKLVAVAFRADGLAPKIVVINSDGTGTPLVVADLAGQANTLANTDLDNVLWSPDGKLISFRVDSAANGQSLLYVVPSDGTMKAPKLLSPAPTVDQEVGSVIAWLDNTHVAFAGDLITNNADNLFTVDVAGAMPTPVPVFMQSTLTTTKKVNGPVALGGDGKVYFRSSHMESNKNLIYRCDANGMNAQAVPAATVMMGNTTVGTGTFRLSRDRMSIAVTADELGNGIQQIFAAKLADAAPVKRTAFAKAPTAPAVSGVDTGPGTLMWSPDGSMIAAVGDWIVNEATDKDNDYALFVVPTAGKPGATRLLNVPMPAMNYDVVAAAWSHDSKRLLVLGDLVTDNNFELYSSADFTTADQSPVMTRVVTVPNGGDVVGAMPVNKP